MKDQRHIAFARETQIIHQQGKHNGAALGIGMSAFLEVERKILQALGQLIFLFLFKKQLRHPIEVPQAFLQTERSNLDFLDLHRLLRLHALNGGTRLIAPRDENDHVLPGWQVFNKPIPRLGKRNLIRPAF